MSRILNAQIIDSAPDRVYVFPQRLTKEEISENVEKLHTIANEEADRTIICMFDELVMSKDIKFEVCFPVTHLDLKKYSVDEFKVIPRSKVVSCEFSGDFTQLSDIIAQLTKYATDNGYDIIPPYRYLFTIHKKFLLSKQNPKFTMEIQIPVKDIH